MPAADLWMAPGPGSWKLDVTHFRAPVEPLQIEPFVKALEDAFRTAFADTGMALAEILFKAVPAGWYYGCALPIAPEQMPARIAEAFSPMPPVKITASQPLRTA